MARLLVLLLLLVCFSFGAALSHFNWTLVSFDYLAGAAEFPLIVLMLGAFLFGALLAGLIGISRSWSRRLEIRRLGRRLAAAEAELKTQREIPMPAGDSGSANSPLDA